MQPPTPPRLPDPAVEYDTRMFGSLLNTLRLYFNRLSGTLLSLFAPRGAISLDMPYAMLMSDQDQASAGTTSANAVTYNQVVLANGVEVRNNSEIWFEKPGQYLITFSLQITNRSTVASLFEVWASRNGTNYPLSNTRYDIPPRKNSTDWSHVVAAVSGIFTVTDPNMEYLTIKWWSDNADVYLEHYAAGTSPARPATPSVILTVNALSRLPPATPEPA